MSKRFFCDTNIFLSHLDFVEAQDKVYLSSVSIKELEEIKTNRNKTDEVRYQSRKAVRWLTDNPDRYEIVSFSEEGIRDELSRRGLADTPDARILVEAYFFAVSELGTLDEDFVFVTNDLLCRLFAKNIFGMKVEGVGDENLDAYKGYKEVSMNDEDMAYFYEHMDENTLGLMTNEYVVLKNDRGETVDGLKWTSEGYIGIKNVPIKSQMFGNIKPLDMIQSFAIDSIINNDITLLYGRSGSGKTTLPLAHIMQGLEKGKISKCYFVYSFEPLKGAKTLGYEKGDHETKVLLSASIGNILSSKFGDMEEVLYLMDKNMIEIIPTANIRGVEFPADSVVMVTEAQNLDVYTLKTIIQRCKSGCKQIYEGDIIEQKDTNIQETGMNRMIEVFKGHKSFGCVKLKNNYRSELSELADMM